jgi:signal transduction histidine kinase
MAADGTLARIVSRWRSFSGRKLEIADALLRAKRKERWLIAGICATILLLLLMLWQAVGIRRAHAAMREKNKELAAALATAQEATELKSQFLANMSHEIRTPMNAILGMTALARDTSDREEEQEYLKDVTSSAESLLSLLNDILDLSKIEAGKMTFDKVDFDPVDAARGVCSLLAEEARRKGLELSCQLPKPLPNWVRGDPARLRQALVNLVSNAIKFTEKGHVELQVAVEAESDRSVTLRFADGHRNRHPRRGAAAYLRVVRAGGPLSSAQIWRHRLGFVDLQGIDCENGRRTPGRKRPPSRIDVQV